MQITRIQIDVDNRRKIKDLNHLGAYHNWVEQLFPEEIEKSKRSRKLWRIDTLKGKKYLLIVSEYEPRAEKFDLYGVEGSGQTKSYDEFINNLRLNQVLRFKVALNPVRSISTGKASGKRGRVVPHVTMAQKLIYFEEKASNNGFSLREGEFDITDSRFDTLRKSGNKSVSISKVTYEGILTITDLEIFKNALKNGIGSKKAYGCGLMTVIPV